MLEERKRKLPLEEGPLFLLLIPPGCPIEPQYNYIPDSGNFVHMVRTVTVGLKMPYCPITVYIRTCS